MKKEPKKDEVTPEESGEEKIEELPKEIPEEKVKQEKPKKLEIIMPENFTPKTENEVLTSMWQDYFLEYQKDKIMDSYMQSIFIINRGNGQIGQELGNLQARIKAKVQILNYISMKIEANKKYEQNSK